jgi:hypothetical protein
VGFLCAFGAQSGILRLKKRSDLRKRHQTHQRRHTDGWNNPDANVPKEPFYCPADYSS